MAGHSKWAQIKRKKAVTDAAKGKLFGRLAKAITLAAKSNPDPLKNMRLKTEIERARSFNMPLDSIERALKRVTDRNYATLSDLQIELFGPEGSALIVTAITDNRNRTIQEIKKISSEHNTHLAQPGSVSWLFSPLGVLHLNTAGLDKEKLHLKAVELGAQDIVEESAQSSLIYCSPDQLSYFREKLAPEVESASIELVPVSRVKLTNPKTIALFESLLQELDECDDVQNIFTNAEF